MKILDHPNRFCGGRGEHADSPVPEVMVEAVPGGELAALVDEHGGGGGAVPGQLLVCRVRGHLDTSDTTHS